MGRGHSPGGVCALNARFIDGAPPGLPAPQERPGRIEYLYLTEDEKPVVDALDRAIDNLPPLTRLRCRNPQTKEVAGKTRIHYPHVDYDERTPPTEREAWLMCQTKGVRCPVAAQCLAAGLAIKAPGGVWGGRVLVDGQDYYGSKTRKKEEKLG